MKREEDEVIVNEDFRIRRKCGREFSKCECCSRKLVKDKGRLICPVCDKE